MSFSLYCSESAASRLCQTAFMLLPQGIFGIWLIVANWRLSGSLPGWLRGLGMIVGVGSRTCWDDLRWTLFYLSGRASAIPAVPQESIKEVNSVANTFIHQLLFYSSFVGVATLPIWTVLTGFQLLKKGRPCRHRIARLSALHSRTSTPMHPYIRETGTDGGKPGKFGAAYTRPAMVVLNRDETGTSEKSATALHFLQQSACTL